MKLRLAALSVAAALAVVSAAPALAAPGTGDAVQAGHQALATFYYGDNAVGQDGTLGAAIAAGWFGNTSNESTTSNGVIPSLAPGIWKCVYVSGSCVDIEKGEPFGSFVSNSVKGQGQP